MAEVSMILLSGGSGQRMGLNFPKQFLLVGGKPLIIHSLEKIDSINEISEIIIPSPKDHIEQTISIISKHNISKPIKYIVGGETRQESVFKALELIKSERVLIHEAVRPFVKTDEFIELIRSDSDNAIYGIDIPFTVLNGKRFIEQNLKREELINVQLPQIFNTNALFEAHKKAAIEKLEFTEDSSLLFHYFNTKIKILKGTEYNIKITKPIDRRLAEIIYRHYILGEE